MSSKPNILIIQADQLAPQFLPCYGHPVVKSPITRRTFLQKYLPSHIISLTKVTAPV